MYKILFVIRAYNDLDCRAPLIYQTCVGAKHEVCVVTFPTNRGFYDFRNFEHLPILLSAGVSFKTFDNFIGMPVPMFTLTVTFFGKLKGINFLPKKLKKIIPYVEKLIFQMLSIAFSFFEKRFNYLENQLSYFDAIVTDEIIFQEGRASFYDALWRMQMKSEKPNIFAILTGQDPYVDKGVFGGEPNAKINKFAWRKSSQIPLIVPGPNDKAVMNRVISSPIHVMGNTRFDPYWVSMIDKQVANGLPPILDNGFEQLPLKLVFFLSKFEYGVKETELFEAINTFSSSCKFRVVVKPHTRGMKMPEIKSKKYIIDGSAYSSTELIQWADVILFTGSSIVYQAMVLGKKIIFLKFCQSRLSIFDGSKISYATSLNELKNLLEYSDKISTEYDSFLLEHVIPSEGFMNEIINYLHCDTRLG